MDSSVVHPLSLPIGLSIVNRVSGKKKKKRKEEKAKTPKNKIIIAK